MTSATHSNEPHGAGIAGKLNWLRAGVLGANDGIMSVAAIVVGVAGATSAVAPIATAGAAGLVGVRSPWQLGEYDQCLDRRQRAAAADTAGGHRRHRALAATFVIGTLLGTSGVV